MAGVIDRVIFHRPETGYSVVRLAQAGGPPVVLVALLPEPLEGERIGTYAGRARLNDSYWARQDYNQLAVARAQARLDRAVQERNALR